MNLSGVPANTPLGKVLRFPLRWIPKIAAVPILQGELRGKRWIVGASNHGCWIGCFEYRKQRRFAERMSPDSVVFDVGAHVGFYTLLASKLAGPRGRVIAFEPLPANLSYLYQHIELNRLTNVMVIEAAVMDRAGSVRFELSESSSMGRVSTSGLLHVRAVSLDSLVQSGRIPAPDVIKMDIEGSEWIALQGAQTILSTYHPHIFLATHGDEIRERCERLLTDLGYELDVIDTDEVLAVHVERGHA